jgi:hypothetical protein
VALIGSLSVLKLAGQSLNTLTLFGLVLASGLVVDDAIVVSEDIGRRLEAGKPPLQAAREAMAELGGAVVSTSIALVVVFIPVRAVQPGKYQPRGSMDPSALETLARSIEHRFPYLDPLNHLQVELMRRYRNRKEGAPENARLQRGIHLSINGVAAGLRNTG